MVTNEITQTAWNDYVGVATGAGVTDEQLRNFAAMGYVAQPTQLEFHAACRSCDVDRGPQIIGYGGSRGPGKSHASLAQAGDDCLRRQGLKVLFLRKYQKSAAESMEDLVYRVFWKLDVNYTPSTGRVTFPNGSRILMGGFKDEKDIEKYIGIEYDLIVIEEVNQITFEKIQKLRGSLRTSRDDWRTRMYWTFNPGGVGHLWLKQNLIEPYRAGTEGEHRLFGGTCRFIPSTYRDNVFLAPEYVDWLLSLEGPLGQAWREGDWDVFEGMAFPMWDQTRHIVDPFEIPAHWAKWRAVDWGFANPWCCLWFAKEPDRGRIYVYRERYSANLTDKQQAETIVNSSPEQIDITYADPSMWARKNQEGLISSTADEYARYGVPLTRADNDRLSGKRKVDRLLADLPDGKPGIVFFSNCKSLISTLPSLPFDENKPEDVDTDAEDHAYDALRYGLTNERAHDRKPDKQDKSPLTRLGKIL